MEDGSVYAFAPYAMREGTMKCETPANMELKRRVELAGFSLVLITGVFPVSAQIVACTINARKGRPLLVVSKQIALLSVVRYAYWA